MPADRTGAYIGFGCGGGEVRVGVARGAGCDGASALVVGGSAGGIAQDGVGGRGGGEHGGVGTGMKVGVVGADQPPVGVGDLSQ